MSSESDSADSTNTDDAAASAEQAIAKALKEKLPQAPIDPESLAKVLGNLISVEVRQLVQYQGPLPPPDMLAEYEKVSPGLAVRIVDRADAEQKFRHAATAKAQELEATEVHYRGISRLVGQLFGFAIGMTAVGGGVALLYQGKSTAGLWSIISGLAALTAVFMTGRVLAQNKGQPAADADGSPVS